MHEKIENAGWQRLLYLFCHYIASAKQKGFPHMRFLLHLSKQCSILVNMIVLILLPFELTATH
jgi:hypothetical protein